MRGTIFAALVLLTASVSGGVVIPGGAAEDVLTVGGGRTARVGTNIAFTTADLADSAPGPVCHVYHFALFGNYPHNSPISADIQFRTTSNTSAVYLRGEMRCVSDGESWYHPFGAAPSSSFFKGSMHASNAAITPQAAGAASLVTLAFTPQDNSCATGASTGWACATSGDCAGGAACNADATAACDPFDLVVLRLCRDTADANTDRVEITTVDLYSSGGGL